MFLLAFTSASIIFHNFLELHSTLTEKDIFVRNFPFLTDSLNPPPPHPLNSQNPLCVTKVFCQCSLNQKGDLQTKTKKANMHILHALNAFNEFCIFKSVSVPNFTWNNFEFWDQIFPKRVFLVQNRKSSHHNWILHIWLRLGSKFQFKLTILIFWTKFAQNWYSKKLHFCMYPWSLLTILNLFARWQQTRQHFSVSSVSSCRDNRECSEYLFCKKFTFEINLPNYLFIWIVKHWSVPSIFKTLEKM